MNREEVFNQLKEDEGVKYEIYNDHLGLATFGVGHLVIESDSEFDSPLGTSVSEERVWEAFEKDLDTSIDECEVLFGPKWHDFPGEVQEIVVNMMFNMGRPRLSKFKNFCAALEPC
jgi:GH24 family phage-related lysozyme (muramidase)